MMIFIFAVFTVLYVIYVSRGKNLKQRAKIAFLGTKLILLLPAYALFGVALVSLAHYINTTLNLASRVMEGLMILYLSTLVFAAILFIERCFVWQNQMRGVK